MRFVLETVPRPPEGWSIERNRFLFREVDDRSDEGTEELLTVSHITGVTRRSDKDVNMFLAESLDGYKRCQPGDLVINTMWAWMGALGVTPIAGIVSPSYHVYRPIKRTLDPGFYDYFFRTPAYVTEVTRVSRGVWTSRLRLYPTEFLDLEAYVPPAPVQRAISSFLARKTAALDALIEKKERLMTLLAEKRAVLIHRAVTNGLNSDVAMKESGAEWVGKVPVHWTVKLLKFACTLQRGLDLPTQDRRDGSVPIIAGGGVTGFHDTAAIEPPGVVTGRYGTVGEVHLVNEPFWPLNTALYVKNFWGNSPAYIRYLLMASPVIAHSGKSAVPGVDRNDVHQIPVAIPSRSEQDAIVKWLDHALMATQAIEHRLQTQLTRLGEYRQSLITAAVTGQLPIEASP